MLTQPPEDSAPAPAIPAVSPIAGRRQFRSFFSKLSRLRDRPLVDSAVWFIAVAGGALLTLNFAVGTPLVLIGGVAYYWMKRSASAAMPQAQQLLRIDAEAILDYARQVGGAGLLSVSVWVPAATGRLDLWAYSCKDLPPAEGRRSINGDSSTAIWMAFTVKRPYVQKQPAAPAAPASGDPIVADGSWSLRVSFPLCHIIDRIRVIGILSLECASRNFTEARAWQLAASLSKHLEPALSAVSEVDS